MNVVKRSNRVKYTYSVLKLLGYLILLVLGLSVTKYLFSWTTLSDIPESLRGFAQILLAINPYVRYLNSAITIAVGYLMVSESSRIVYTYMRNFADHATSATIQNLTKILGIALILSIMASIYYVDPAAALTLGSFTGLLVGFAAQTFLSNMIAGLFILITRPFTFGDVITLAGQTGVVKEIRIMHLHMETDDGKKAIMIPNNVVLNQVLLKNLPGEALKPIKTQISLGEPQHQLTIGERVTLRGDLIELDSGKPIANSMIYLLDRDVGRDDWLSEGLSDEHGRFEVTWVVKQVDPFDDTAELYVKYLGDDTHRNTNSSQYSVKIVSP